MRNVVFQIGDEKIDYTVEGETLFGADQILLALDDNLIAETAWADAGHTNQSFLTDSECTELRQGLKNQLWAVVQKNFQVDPSRFSLEKYHDLVDDAKHAQVTGEMRQGFRVEELPVSIQKVEQRISEICKVELTSICPSMGWGGYFIRIVRPTTKKDNNPPHRDVWLEHLRGCVNIYFPLAGSNSKSALPIVEGSHLWKESDIERTAKGAEVDGVSFYVPTVVGAKKDMRLIRPNPQNNDVMVFSPYAIHGGGINLNPDITRISLEMRFWRKK